MSLAIGTYPQVRVQMAAVGCPLLGDRLYGALVARGALSRSSSSSSLAAADVGGGEDVRREAVAQQGSGQQEGAKGEQQRVRGEALEWCRPALEQQLAPVALQVGLRVEYLVRFVSRWVVWTSAAVLMSCCLA